MFLLDDILLSPVKALMAIGRHIQETAGKNLEDQEKAILNDLSELHQLLESGAVGDAEFDTRETVLLDRLDSIQRAWKQKAKKEMAERAGPTERPSDNDSPLPQTDSHQA